MVTKDDIQSISYLKNHTKQMIEQVSLTRRPLFITQKGKARAVIIDTDTFDNLTQYRKMLKVLLEDKAMALKNRQQEKEGDLSVETNPGAAKKEV